MAVLGGLIGLEREIREHSAGFRTHILVAVGAAAFTLASSYGLEGTDHDPNRISAQVVTGIGFLGAGAIIRYGVTVRGLTTAASLWAVAAVGLTVGQGFYSAALVTTAVVIVSLYVLGLIEKRILYKRVATCGRREGPLPFGRLHPLDRAPVGPGAGSRDRERDGSGARRERRRHASPTGESAPHSEPARPPEDSEQPDRGGVGRPGLTAKVCRARRPGSSLVTSEKWPDGRW